MLKKKLLCGIAAMLIMTATGCGQENNETQAVQQEETESTTDNNETQDVQQEEAESITEDADNAETTKETESEEDPETAAETEPEAEPEETTPNTSATADEDAYAAILDVYYYELKSQNTYEDFWMTKPFNPMATYAYSKDGYDKSGSLEYTGYGFEDLNGDGVDELIIGNMSDDERLDKMVYLIGTIHNNVPYGVLTSMESGNYYICDDNKISYECRGNLGEDYKLYQFSSDGTATECIGGISSYKNSDTGEISYKTTDKNGTTVDEISEEEFETEKKNILAKKVQIQLTPFTNYNPRNPEDAIGADWDTVFGKGFNSWNEGYLAYYNEQLKDYDNGLSYALIYVDDDDIPELVIDTGVEAGGCQILSYNDGMVTVLQTARIYFTYIEKGGLLCNSDGHMGYYYDYVYKLDKGKWTPIFSGNYYEFEETDEGEVVDYDEETGRYRTLHYEIDGEETDEMTYLEKLGEIYDRGLAKEPENYLSSDELLTYISENEN